MSSAVVSGAAGVSAAFSEAGADSGDDASGVVTSTGAASCDQPVDGKLIVKSKHIAAKLAEIHHLPLNTFSILIVRFLNEFQANNIRQTTSVSPTGSQRKVESILAARWREFARTQAACLKRA
ncbi:hypothetical protein [Schlesneria sp. T3-172]|uniref:hypothetical protein n=1 Tax=Schlesneria sphaerica TaxID=3373610 RepID=UPI0037C6D068